MEKLVLIDGNSLINRAFYAMPLLSNKDGIATNAVYGFMNMFIKMLGDYNPKYIAVAFDVHAPTFRHKMFTEYKGTRKPMPDDLRPQIPLLKELLKTMGICTLELAGYEADDIIGTVAKSTSVPTIIITGDRDSFQLVDNETSVLFTKRGITETDLLTNDNFKEKIGINPVQIIDLKALMGDASDNIPGVAGIGEKTALTLVQTYGDIDNLYSHIEELKGKLKEKIESDKESCYLSKTLATIDTNVPIDTDLNKMTFPFPFSTETKKRFIDLEFKSILKREDLFVKDEKETEEIQKTVEKKQINIIKIDEASKLKDIKLSSENALIIGDTCINIFDLQDTEYVIPIRQSLLDDGLEFSTVLKSIKEIFSTDLILYGKKDINKAISPLNIEITGKTQDLALIKYLADFSNGDEKLNDVITSYGYSDLSPAYAMFLIYQELYAKLKEQGMEKLYKDVELPLSDVLFEMEKAGFKVNVKELNATGEKYKKILADLETKIKELAGDEALNVNSTKQLGELLFVKLKIGKGKKTKTGFSTNAEVLEKFEDAHPIIPLILQYRGIQKLNSTYVEGLKPLIDKETGLIHTYFNQTLTSTGRLSSKEPNLQNIPVRDEEGKMLRKFFIPSFESGALVGADYSQIELRLMASFSNCKSLIDAFKNGQDIHSSTASKVFKVEIKDVTPTMRRQAKAVNFGIIYGISEYGLAKNIKVSNAQARDYIDSYFREYPEIKNYMDDCIDKARKLGYAETLLGRRRYIKELESPSFAIRQFGERVAMNMPLQGSSADIIKIAMVNVSNRIKKENLKSKLILQVHDELICDCPQEEVEKVKAILKEEMENAVNLSVPLTVELEVGSTWYDAK